MNTIKLTMEATPENLRCMADALAGQRVCVTSADGTTFKLADAPQMEKEPLKDPTVPEKKAPDPAVTKSDIRRLGNELSKIGKSGVIKAALEALGAEKLSQVEEKDYPALAEKLQEALS